MEQERQSMPEQARNTMSDEEVEKQAEQAQPADADEAPEPEGRRTRSTFNFWLGMLTTLLVATAWSTNLITKPLATAFGGSVSLLGMAIAYACYRIHKKRGRIPVIVTGVEQQFPAEILAVLTADHERNSAVIDAAVNNPGKKPVVFLYLGQQSSDQKPEVFRLIEPHLNDAGARKALGKANHDAAKAHIDCRFLYRCYEPDTIAQVWETLRPHDTIVAPGEAAALQRIHPNRTYEQALPDGKAVHLIS
jgi:hypothetical protein